MGQTSNYNEQKNKYTQEYIREHYKQLSIRIPKAGDLTRETIQAAASSVGESVNAFILEAVRQRMDYMSMRGQNDGYYRSTKEGQGEV